MYLIVEKLIAEAFQRVTKGLSDLIKTNCALDASWVHRPDPHFNLVHGPGPCMDPRNKRAEEKMYGFCVTTVICVCVIIDHASTSIPVTNLITSRINTNKAVLKRPLFFGSLPPPLSSSWVQDNINSTGCSEEKKEGNVFILQVF